MPTFLQCTYCGARNSDPNPSLSPESFVCGNCGQPALQRIATAEPSDARTGKAVAGATVGAAIGGAIGGAGGALIGGLLGLIIGGGRR